MKAKTAILSYVSTTYVPYLTNNGVTKTNLRKKTQYEKI